MAYRNIAAISKPLETQMRKFDFINITIGTVTLIMGGVSVGAIKTNMYMSLVTTAVATFLTGHLGLYASWRRNLSFHSATLGVAILATWLGIKAYNNSLEMTSNTSVADKHEALILADLLVIVLNLIVTTMTIGKQAMVLYLSTTTPASVQEPPQHDQPQEPRDAEYGVVNMAMQQ